MASRPSLVDWVFILLSDPILPWDRSTAGMDRGLSRPLRSTLGFAEVGSNLRVLELSGEAPCPDEEVRLCPLNIPGLGLRLGFSLSSSKLAFAAERAASSWTRWLSGGLLLEDPERVLLRLGTNSALDLASGLEGFPFSGVLVCGGTFNFV